MPRQDIEIDEPAEDVFEPFVFDRRDPLVQVLIKLGVPESRLKELDAADRIRSEELGLAFPAPSLVEKRYR